ncbi:MAG: ROK family protein [Coprobacillaceae bacterium]
MKTILGVDLGGTKILIGEISITGEVLSKKNYSSVVTSQREAINRVKDCINDFFETTEIKGEVQGIGLGLVGRIDRKKGIWIEIHPELSNAIEVSKEIEREFNLPCYLGNDVYCATLSEKTYGMGNKTDHFIYMNIGTGIAAGFVVDGKIMEGANYDADEIGHLVVDYHSNVECPCGRTGCVEVLASGLGLHNRAMSLLDTYPNSMIKKPVQGRISAKDLFLGYENQDELCKKVIDDALDATATTIMNLIRVTDPKAIVLGGGVVNDGWFIDYLLPRMNQKTIRFISEGIARTKLEPSTIGLRGAALLVNEHINKENK